MGREEGETVVKIGHCGRPSTTSRGVCAPLDGLHYPKAFQCSATTGRYSSSKIMEKRQQCVDRHEERLAAPLPPSPPFPKTNRGATPAGHV